MLDATLWAMRLLGLACGGLGIFLTWLTISFGDRNALPPAIFFLSIAFGAVWPLEGRMIGLRNAVWISLGLWLAGWVLIAHAQQSPTPAEQITVLQTKLAVEQQNLDNAYLALARTQAAAAKQAGDDEAQKATLIDWLKEAQAKEAKVMLPKSEPAKP